MSDGGFALAGLTLGLGAISLKAARGFFPAGGASQLLPHATLEEIHYDDLEITDHPVEQGAAVTDHAFKRPAEVIIHCAWSNSAPTSTGILSRAANTAVGLAAAKLGSTARTVIGAASTVVNATDTVQSLLGGNAPGQVNAIYDTFIAAQRGRVLFDVYTGKRRYKNMMIRSLSVTTDPKSENALRISVVCREILIVTTTTVKVPIKPATAAAAQRFGSIRDFGQAQLNKVPSAIADALKIPPIVSTINNLAGFLK